MSTLIELARAFAIGAHSAIGQTRKDGKTPYYEHVIDVAMRVRILGGTPQMVAAAYLHDVLEDTKVTVADINLVFPPSVGVLVWHLTDQFTYPKDKRPRKDRKMDETIRLSRTSDQVQTIKLCDVASNLSGFMLDKDFGLKFIGTLLHETGYLIRVLSRGDPAAREMAASAWEKCNADYQAELTRINQEKENHK